MEKVPREGQGLVVGHFLGLPALDHGYTSFRPSSVHTTLIGSLGRSGFLPKTGAFPQTQGIHDKGQIRAATAHLRIILRVYSIEQVMPYILGHHQ